MSLFKLLSSLLPHPPPPLSLLHSLISNIDIYIYIESKEQKLANLRKERLEEAKEERNRWTVIALYEALNARDVEAVHRLLAPDIEWWFHGPPGCQHMMRLLTGVSSRLPFDFAPLSVEPFDHTVLVEGCDNSGSVFVTRVAFSSGETTVWNSRLPETAGKSLPGLVLAI